MCQLLNLRVGRSHLTLSCKGPILPTYNKVGKSNYMDRSDVPLFSRNIVIHGVTITCISQAKFSHDMPCETVSKINLVDLAGR